jgi:NAD(P)-dependent dehydrogenase (short-subunit alcohol dehydrogenase family)
MSISLANKIILVTGAGSGIGQAAAKAFAKAGARVILVGRTLGKLEQTYDQIEAEGGEALLYPMDLLGATPEDYQTLAAQLANHFESLDGLLHNAAQLGQLAPISLADPSEWYKTLQVNLNAPFLLTQALLPLLEKAPSASVLYTSSGVAQTAMAYWGAYSVSKSAQDHLMKTLAQEYAGKAVRFNSINPGIVRSAMRAKAFPAENPNNLTSADSLMPAYLWLISENSAGETGQIFSAPDLINQLKA